jgi:hypothetical protein
MKWKNRKNGSKEQLKSRNSNKSAVNVTSLLCVLKITIMSMMKKKTSPLALGFVVGAFSTADRMHFCLRHLILLENN